MERFGFRIEPRSNPSDALVLAISLAAIVAALLSTAIIFAFFGVNPVEAFRIIAERNILSYRGFTEVIRKSIPLLLAGVGLVLAFRAQFWNIGAEGQILAGAVAAAGLALFVDLPGWLMIPAMFIAGFLAGGLWGFLPALLKVRLGVNEIITTLMMNYIALYIVRWLINGPWKGQSTVGFSYSEKFDEAYRLPTLASYGRDWPGFNDLFTFLFWFPERGATRLHWPTLLLGLIVVIFIMFMLSRMQLGFAIRIMGESPNAARYAGINFFSTTLFLVALSAGAAGLAGVGEVAGIHHRLVEPNSISLGYGYTAIIVALLARGRPLAVILSAFFMGLVFASGDVMKASLGLPSQMTGVISGLVLLFVISSEPLIRYKLVRVKRDDA